MEKGLRLAHIAVRQKISDLAHAKGFILKTGEDDLGPFRYFDLKLYDDDLGTSQSVRFAAHDCDQMTHLLAENIGADGELAAALFAVGISRSNELSISTDQNGKPLRKIRELQRFLNDAHKVAKFDRSRGGNEVHLPGTAVG